jgi:hypothetical protein
MLQRNGSEKDGKGYRLNFHKMKADTIINLLNATYDNPYSPDGTFNLIWTLDKCISNSDNSALKSRLKAFLFPKAFGTFQYLILIE